MLKKYIFLCALSIPVIIDARLGKNMPSQPENPILSTRETTQKNEVILFHKPGCPYCTYINPLFNQLQKQNQGKASFKKINISGNSSYKFQYGFSTVPTVVYIKDGRIIAKHGSNNKTIKLADMQRCIQSF